ncbi:MAG: hypothetical protein CL908_25700 [Deltaproteobacteria bacterium]|nr:hypothetical protein [Deltaproteobacteria bacterium]
MSINFIARTEAPLVSDYRDPTKIFRPSEAHDVRLTDMRSVRSELDLETHGFILVDDPRTIPDALDEEWMREDYDSSMQNLTKTFVADADMVFPLVLYLRVSPNSSESVLRKKSRTAGVQPGLSAHVDFTSNSVWARVRQAQKAGTIPDIRYKRAAVYQTWRVLSDPPHDFPLAVTDHRSTRPGQFLPLQNILEEPEAEEKLNETGLVVFSDYDWYYFSDMQRDELLVFKGYDTENGDGRNVFHSSFENTACRERLSPRISVETRCMALWE